MHRITDLRELKTDHVGSIIRRLPLAKDPKLNTVPSGRPFDLGDSTEKEGVFKIFWDLVQFMTML